MTLWRQAARRVGDRIWQAGADDSQRATADGIALYLVLWFGVWVLLEIATALDLLSSVVLDMFMVGAAVLGAILLWRYVPRSYGPPASRGVGIVLMVASFIGIAIWDFWVSAVFIPVFGVGCWMVFRALPNLRQR